jgi:hypothetical protein
MEEAFGVLIVIFKNAWYVMVEVLVAVTILALMYNLLRGTSAAAAGGSGKVAETIGIGISLVILAIFALQGAPAILRAGYDAIPKYIMCNPGPVGDSPLKTLSIVAIELICGIVALRMLLAMIQAVGALALGATSVVAGTLLEGAEALFGLLLVSVAVPVVTAFFQVCA